MKKAMIGDIVELMSPNKYNNEEVSIGERFRVITASNYFITVGIQNTSFRSGVMILNHCQYFVYKRSFINHIKSWLNLSQ